MGTSDVHVALERVTRRLEEIGVPYAICGGLAVNAHGYERTTTDIDLIVTAEGLAKFKSTSLGLGWLDKFAGSRGVKDTENKIPIDFLVTGGIPGDGKPRGVAFPDPTGVTIEKAGKRYLSLAKLIELKIATALSVPQRVQDVADVVKEGDEVLVKVVGIDRTGKIRLSRKEALGQQPDQVLNMR